jgi:hypothetical protein
MSQAPAIHSVRRADRVNLNVQVQALLSRLRATVVVERRRDPRAALPVLLRLTPLDADMQTADEESIIVVGKNISRHGLSFYHERPLPYRRAVISLAQPGLGEFTVEIDVNWCRFRAPGWYESGGRLLRAIDERIVT